MTRRILIYDTTLRDGAQTEGITFSLRDKILLARRMDQMGIDFIEGGYPASNKKDDQFFQRISEINPQHSSICAFGMTRRKGLKVEEDPGMISLVESGVPVLTIVGKSSAYQAEEVIRTTKKENLLMIQETIAWCCSKGYRVFYDAEHFFDGWKNDPDYSIETLKVAMEAGAESVTLCDTNGGCMPNEIAVAVHDVVNQVSIPVGIHTHNDCGLAVANTLTAVDAGASIVQGTVNGWGERCGNADLIVIIANLLLKKNGNYELLHEDSLQMLTDFSRYFYEITNINPLQCQPYVGRSAFAHKGGMHVSGIQRDSHAYEHIVPETIGNKRRVLISELSGRTNILVRTAKFNIQNDSRLLGDVLDAVVQKESEGYQYEAAEGSFDLLVRKTAGLYKPHFECLSFQTNVGASKAGVYETLATIKLKIGNVIRLEVAEGNGPVDALNAAMRKALSPLFPELHEVTLVDYKVMVLNSEAATAAITRVVIQSKDQEEMWGTVGVDENIIQASWIALCDSIEYKLAKSIRTK